MRPDGRTGGRTGGRFGDFNATWWPQLINWDWVFWVELISWGRVWQKSLFNCLQILHYHHAQYINFEFQFGDLLQDSALEIQFSDPHFIGVHCFNYLNFSVFIKNRFLFCHPFSTSGNVVSNYKPPLKSTFVAPFLWLGYTDHLHLALSVSLSVYRITTSGRDIAVWVNPFSRPTTLDRQHSHRTTKMHHLLDLFYFYSTANQRLLNEVW